MNFKINTIVVALMGLLLLASCEKSKYEAIESVDTNKITNFLKSNNLTFAKSDSGYYYHIVNNGTGPVMKYEDSVAYYATYKSLAGQVFYQSSLYRPMETLLGYLNPAAAHQSLINLKAGAEIRLIIPSYLAFKIAGNPSLNIGPNENLDVTFKTVSIPNRAEFEDQNIQKYIADKAIKDVVKTADGIYYTILTPGDGKTMIGLNSSITTTFSGSLLGDTFPFSGGSGTGALFILEDNIVGWQKVLNGKSKGIKLRCFLPSRYAYGNAVNSSTGESTFLAPNAVLDFTIEITDVK